MPAARQQAEKRRLERGRLEVERRDVPLQVVDGNERQAARPGDRLRGGEADEQRADQPRALCHRELGDVVEGGIRFAERLPDHGRHELEVSP